MRQEPICSNADSTPAPATGPREELAEKVVGHIIIPTRHLHFTLGTGSSVIPKPHADQHRVNRIGGEFERTGVMLLAVPILAVSKILTHAAIGGAIGGLVGVVIWFIKRNQGK